MSRQSCLLDAKCDNDVKAGAVHRSPGNFFMAEGYHGKPLKAVQSVIALVGVLSLKCGRYDPAALHEEGKKQGNLNYKRKLMKSHY